MRKISVLGAGLLGGSILRALVERFPDCLPGAWGRSPQALEPVVAALGNRVCTHSDPAQAVEGAQLIVFCTPVEAMPGLAEQIAPHILPEAWLTDVGSVKQPVVEALEKIFGGRFLGAHPMAGSEKQGFAHSRADLFQGAPCILTPTERTHPGVLFHVRSFWQALGCRTTEMSPVEHDQTVAWISHLPHVVAAALSLSVPPGTLLFAGPGFRDTTRVAMGDPLLWRGILTANARSLCPALEHFAENLKKFAELMAALPTLPPNSEAASALEQLLREAREKRTALCDPARPAQSPPQAAL